MEQINADSTSQRNKTIPGWKKSSVAWCVGVRKFPWENHDFRICSDLNSDITSALEIAKSGANLVSDRKVDFPWNLESVQSALADFYGHYSSQDLHILIIILQSLPCLVACCYAICFSGLLYLAHEVNRTLLYYCPLGYAEVLQHECTCQTPAMPPQSSSPCWQCLLGSPWPYTCPLPCFVSLHYPFLWCYPASTACCCVLDVP